MKNFIFCAVLNRLMLQLAMAFALCNTIAIKLYSKYTYASLKEIIFRGTMEL